MSQTQTQGAAALETTAAVRQYLTFRLAGEQYGVDILRVQGIQGWDRVTPIPNTPDYVLGVINLRGEVVPIVDLKKRFCLPEAGFGRTTVVIIVRVETAGRSRTVGLVVDAVCDVTNVSAAEVKPAPDLGSGIETDFLRGLVSIDERMVILLDADHLINEGVMAGAVETPELH